MSDAPNNCAGCGKASGFDGCSRIECPKRKPWGAGLGADLAMHHSGITSTQGADGPVQVSSSGCYRRNTHQGAQ